MIFSEMNIKIDDKIKLVPISLDYSSEIFKSFDSEIIRFLPIDKPPEKLEETIAFIKHSIEQMNNETDFVWVILDKNKFTGCCGIHNLKSKQPHFGLWIKKERQGKGIGKKVVNQMLHWGVSNMDVDFIKYPVDIRNKKSISLIKGLELKLSDQYEMGNKKKLVVNEYRLYKK